MKSSTPKQYSIRLEVLPLRVVTFRASVRVYIIGPLCLSTFIYLLPLVCAHTGNMVTSSLKVSVEAWVEFLHRGRRRVQRAFVLAVRGASAAHLHALASKTKSGDDPMASSPRSTRSYAWICLRTRRDLSGVLTAHWESVEVAEAAGSWRSRPRPRVIRHMSTADQAGLDIPHPLGVL